jgi:hypothetical protein
LPDPKAEIKNWIRDHRSLWEIGWSHTHSITEIVVWLHGAESLMMGMNCGVFLTTWDHNVVFQKGSDSDNSNAEYDSSDYNIRGFYDQYKHHTTLLFC